MKKEKNYPEIIFEDEKLLVFNKPSGMPVISNGNDKCLSLCEWVHKEINPNFFNVHRLDAETSGIVLFAKDRDTLSKLFAQFEKKETVKIYMAFVRGLPNFETKLIDMPVEKDPNFPVRMRVVKSGGKQAITQLVVKEKFKRFALIEAEPLTGRTHQIRLHLAAIGLPIVGDELYGKSRFPFLSEIKQDYKPSKRKIEKPLIERLALHAYSLTVLHPSTMKPITFKADIPEDFEILLKYMRKYALAI